jgi:hypothetical protein
MKSVLYGAFVWARRALNGQNRRFLARADPITWAVMDYTSEVFTGAQDRTRPNVMGLASFGLKIDICCDFLYSILPLSLILGLDLLGLALFRPQVFTASVGDTVTFSWGGTHNVFLHPTGTCDATGATVVGSSSGAVYTFAAAGSFTFACEVGPGLGRIVALHHRSSTQYQNC